MKLFTGSRACPAVAFSPLAALLTLSVTALVFTGCGSLAQQLATSGTAVKVPARTTTAAPGPIVITRGGTYTGSWRSDDVATPAVQIETAEPVLLRNATITGRGDLISIAPVVGGANVDIENVTGTALDPGISGLQRGSFITAESVTSLTVHHCSIVGARFGVKLLSSTPLLLSVTANLAQHLEDRESDGNGGFLPSRPDLGHFVMLNGVSAPAGAEIAWNAFINTIGQDSTEDVINLYKSEGSPAHTIAVHDNYIEGNASPSAPGNYTGAGLIADGDASTPETAYVTFQNNQVVHTAGSGVEIAAGHDILVTGNRIVSCGQDATGTWFAAPFVNAVTVWNDYGVANFNNITVGNTAGGMLRPDRSGAPMIADFWAQQRDLNSTDLMLPNQFSDPCLQGGTPNLGAENTERAYWQTKLTQNNITVGDAHSPE